MHLFPVALLLATAALSGCATNVADCDPTTGDASFVTKFNCNYSGTYDGRVETKEQSLKREQAANAQFKAVYAALDRQKTQVNKDVQHQQASYNELNQSMNVLLAQMKSKAAGKKQIQQKIADLEKSMKQKQAQPPQSEMAKQLELEELRSQVASLQKDLDLQ